MSDVEKNAPRYYQMKLNLRCVINWVFSEILLYFRNNLVEGIVAKLCAASMWNIAACCRATACFRAETTVAKTLVTAGTVIRAGEPVSMNCGVGVEKL